MNKNLLIGVGVGLIGYYLLFKHGKKKCSCGGGSDKPSIEPAVMPTEQSKCEDLAMDRMKTMRFASPEARDAWKADFVKNCMAGAIK